MSEREVVLVTGASTGIGRATAERLRRAGYRVFAAARRAQSVGELSAEAFDAVAIDVDDDASVERGVREVLDRAGQIDVLVNNAGYELLAPVELITPDALRAQFETNVVGAHRMVRAVLPGMRARGRGTIVQVSSVVGRVAMPLYGAYAASKFAMEAMSDALRVEVAPFGVRVVLVEPGPIRSELARKAEGLLDALLADPRAAAYAGMVAGMRAARAKSKKAAGLGPEAVAEVVERAIRAKRPAARYPVTSIAKVGPVARAVLPTAWFDALVARSVKG